MTTDNDKCILGLDAIEMGEFFQTIKDIKKDTERIVNRLDQQNGRIRKLENWRSYMLGVIAVASVLVPIIVKYVI